MQHEQKRKVYTVKEIQEMLNISRTAAYALMHRGLFPVVQIGRSIRIPAEKFDAWFENF